MLVSIITINRNNAFGLEKTMESVLSQDRTDFEYIVVDGASSDGSIGIVQRFAPSFGDRLKWVSEPDKGIYNAMNKGIRMAEGEYVEFVNSGDVLVSENVIQRMYKALEESGYPSILYGNMLKEMQDGCVFRDKCFAGEEMTLLGFYHGTLNHSPTWIRRDLFDKYGLYDEALKIDSDWKWFLQAIILGEERPAYINIDVTRFDMTGISETNKELAWKEKEKELSTLIPVPILRDYEQWFFPIHQMKRLQRHPWAYKMVWLLERCLFKMEKCCRKKTRIKGWD